MAVAIQESPTDVDRVTAAVLDVYTRRRDLAAEMPLAELLDVPTGLGSLRAVVSDTDRAIEIVLDTGFDAADVVPGLWALAAKGWQPVVLIALDRIGEAHGELRGAPCRLQPWWVVDGTVVFGSFEIP